LNSPDDLKHLKRWIQASIVKTLRPLIEQGFEIFVEGEDRSTNKSPKFFEVRVDGPYVYPHGSKGEMRSYIEVNLLGNSTRSEGNIYDRQNLQGLLSFLLNRDFCIRRTGNEGKVEADNNGLVGRMQLIPSDAIKTSDFGMIESNTEVFQCVVEAHYEMYH